MPAGGLPLSRSLIVNTAKGLVILASTLLAQHPDYFPLQPNNQWIYRCSGFCPNDGVVKVEILGFEKKNDRFYAVLLDFDGNRKWIRQDEQRRVWEYDPIDGEEKIWYDFSSKPGEQFKTNRNPCNPTASLEPEQTYEGPIGKVPNALRVRYSNRCRDAGLDEEWFVAYVGLIARSEITLAGPRRYDLIYSQTGGVTYVRAEHLTFTLALDQHTYYINRMPTIGSAAGPAKLTARLSIRNTQSEPIKLVFPNGQTYEFVICDENGKEVYRWSRDKAFTQAIREVELGWGEKNFVVVVPLIDEHGQPLPPGQYVAEAWLTTIEPATPFRATVPFKIEHVF